jgi:nitrate reductase cytochrome c-type subunit
MASRAPLPVRIVAIAVAAGAMLVMILFLLPEVREAREARTHPTATPMASPGPPIAAEAFPYRLRAHQLAVAPDVQRRPQAHPRTLATHRSLRAYPGAPPRIPHGLTDREYREGRCNSCHERGGYVPRFSTYAPVTPHPELSECMQCHAPDAMTVGLGIPLLTADVICGQCHVDPDAPPPSLVALDWRPASWPELDQRAMEGSPPMIPHTLQLRETCLACHAGPWAVVEIRTTHPERTDCRACHVPLNPEEGEAFTRPLDGRPATAGGSR